MITTLSGKQDVLQYAQNGKFVIYGAGQVGITLLRYLAVRDLIDNVLSFAVSNYFHKESEEIMGVPVYEAVELPANSRVLIAVHPKLHDEITGTLTEYGITDITGVGWDCYLQMRRTIHDFSTEQFRLIIQKTDYITDIVKEIVHLPEVVATNTAAFAEYENAFEGRDVVLLGTGPSLNKYKPIEGAIHIGVNGAYKFDKVKLDYLFAQDFYRKGWCGEVALDSYIDDLKKLDCKKFIGHACAYSFLDCINLPEKDYIGTDFIRYIHTHHIKSSILHRDIKFYPTFDFCTVAHSAIQFALFAHPRRIYIVGCDGVTRNSVVHSDSSRKASEMEFHQYKLMKTGWEKVKQFAEIHYPDVEIISVNPGFLKGLFKDIMRGTT
jgi:hypothetical protein